MININLGKFLNGRWTLSNVTLKDSIKFAYELPSDELIAESNKAIRFDIEALAPPDNSMAQLHLMTQDLLAERLHLMLKRELKNSPSGFGLGQEWLQAHERQARTAHCKAKTFPGRPPDRPGLFAAVREQLGLKLESRRGPLELLVVEQASRIRKEIK